MWLVNLILLLTSLIPAERYEEPTPLPPAAPTPAPTVAPVPADGAGAVHGFVTHYGASYEGSPLGCGTGVYRSADPTIAASAYDLATGARPYQCGEHLEVCGTAACNVVTVVDACPGCSWNHLDLSEAGQALVCGAVGVNCSVTIRRVQ